MANALYDPGREGFLDGSYNWASNDMRVLLCKTGYSFSAAHKFLADGGGIGTTYDNGRSAALGSKTSTSGVADAADTTITASAATNSIALILFYHTGSDATARLIAYIDTATGLPFTPAAAQVISIIWDNGANKIFKL